MKASISVLFVCLGNICRSPMAEGLFAHHVAAAGLADRFRIDSAGTGNWHVGEWPDPRMRQTAESHGVVLPSCARQITPADLTDFDYVLCMDAANQMNTKALGTGTATLQLVRDYDPALMGDVPDPYWGTEADFEAVYQMLDRTTQSLLAALREKL
jgi:protein-tyrosine phosphatase